MMGKLNNQKKPKSIRSVLTRIYSSLLLLLLVILLSVSYLLLRNQQITEIHSNSSALVRQTKDSMDSKLKEYEIGLRIINNLNELQTFASDKKMEFGGENIVYISEKNELFEKIYHIINVTSEVSSVAVYLNEQDTLCSFSSRTLDENYYDYVSGQYENMLSQKDLLRFCGPMNVDGTEMVLIMQQIIDNQNMDRLGVLIFNCDINSIARELRGTELSSENAAFLVNADGTCVAASDTKLYQLWKAAESKKAQGDSDKIELAGMKYLVTKTHSEYTGWDMIGLVSIGEREKQMFFIQLWLILGAVLGGLLIVLFSRKIASYISNPIERLSRSMRLVAKEQRLDVQYEDHSLAETEELGVCFMGMIHDIDELMVKNWESELREKEARLNALQAQINPHFLFNALNTIHYMLILNEEKEVSELVVNLGDFLRNGLDGVKKIVSVSDELVMVEKYMNIQRARFGEELVFISSVTEKAAQCLIIGFLLQPLIENAIAHGFEKTGGIGTIFVRGYTDEETGNLYLEVEDDGQGMTPWQAGAALKPERQTDGHRHIGLENVNQRIKLYYGKTYGAEIVSEQGKGTLVRLILPSEGAKQDENENSDS